MCCLGGHEEGKRSSFARFWWCKREHARRIVSSKLWAPSLFSVPSRSASRHKKWTWTWIKLTRAGTRGDFFFFDHRAHETPVYSTRTWKPKRLEPRFLFTKTNSPPKEETRFTVALARSRECAKELIPVWTNCRSVRTFEYMVPEVVTLIWSTLNKQMSSRTNFADSRIVPSEQNKNSAFVTFQHDMQRTAIHDTRYISMFTNNIEKRLVSWFSQTI